MSNSQLLYGTNVRANGIRQHYLRYGGADGERASRDPVIVVPGITSPAITWGFVGERLGRHFDTYVLDVRGRGLSTAAPGLDYSLDAQAEDLIALAEALGLARASVVGHSMGARIGLPAWWRSIRLFPVPAAAPTPPSCPGTSTR